MMVLVIFIWSKGPQEKKPIGCRLYPIKVGYCFCACMGHWSRGLKRPGGRVTFSQLIEGYASD
jgi:hypothetical protein